MGKMKVRHNNYDTNSRFKSCSDGFYWPMDSKYLHCTVREGGLIRETKLPLQELELRMQGGLMCNGGVFAGA